jgi:hypothetical protein
MRIFVLALLLAATLTACSGIPAGSVDRSCNPGDTGNVDISCEHRHF